MSFIECDTCRAKPGTPTLCAGCHTNRKTICKLEKREADAHAMFEAENKARVDAVRKVAELEEERDKMIPAYEAIEHVKDQRDQARSELAELKKDIRGRERLAVRKEEHWNADRQVLNGHIVEAGEALAKLEKERDELRDKPEKPEYTRDHGIDCYSELMDAVFGDANDLSHPERVKQAAERRNLLTDLLDATKGHTMENITTIMQAMPPAEELEGHEVEYRYPRIGDSAWVHHELRWTVVDCEKRADVSAIIRTPIIEYIPNEEIADSLIDELGRIECEVWNLDDKSDVEAAQLAMVREDNNCTYEVIGAKYFAYLNCRIKRSTIESLRASRSCQHTPTP